MISIALIGGTGTGKSTVAAYLKEHYGAVWLDCDAIGHELLNEPIIQTQLIDRFGTEILNDPAATDKTVNRQKLGAIVFSDSQALTDLNALLHPPIMSRLRQEQIHAEKTGVPICVLDGALLMDVNIRQMVDEVWAITADKELRMERLMKGRQIPRARAEQIMQNQISAEAYATYADRVINTDHGEQGYAKTIEQILSLDKWKNKRKYEHK
ncbi:dephospho-CoA kinase [Clostridiales bacterium COT073_COT-073]|nr:dephospho-CoA kinase [Clostridiales bacterium COT073_COT-073]